MRLVYAINHVSEMKRSVVFYRDASGLKLSFESPYWTDFPRAKLQSHCT